MAVRVFRDRAVVRGREDMHAAPDQLKSRIVDLYVIRGEVHRQQIMALKESV